MDIKQYVIDRAKTARDAARKMSGIGTEVKNKALIAMATSLESSKEEIISANLKDIEYGKSMGFSDALIDRLMLNEKRIEDMAEGLRQLAALPDPIGEVPRMWTRPNGLQIGQIRVPLGVIGMIYEARPNVTVDAAGICLKTGNAVILRGGKEAINSNIAISRIISSAAVQNGMPEGCIQLIDITDKEAVNIMLKSNEYFDVIIPRGGAGLIRTVVENATVPVIETGVGNCHVYIDSEADLNMAEDIAINAKTHRPAVCNAMETLLIHEKVAKDILPSLSKKLIEKGVEIRGCERVREVVAEAREANEDDWSCEYLNLILAVKIVASLDEALEHIYKYGTKHSEAIVTRSYENSRRFLKEVDAAAVYVNASTRFTDGFQFGFGAEIGISTQKLHARGPMGLTELTTTKYIIYGEGQIRE